MFLLARSGHPARYVADMHPSHTLVALTLVAVCTLGACAGDAESGPTQAEESASPAIDVCASLTADEVGQALGGPVTVQIPPGGGCNFRQEDPLAPSAALAQSGVDDSVGGFEAMRAGVTSMIDGEVDTLDGVGDEAFVVASNTLSGSSVTGGGGVLIGNTMVQLTLLQSQDMPDDEVRRLLVDVLTLVASKA